MNRSLIVPRVSRNQWNQEQQRQTSTSGIDKIIRQKCGMDMTAREKIQGMWFNLRSTFDESDNGSTLSRLKTAIDEHATFESAFARLFGSCTTGMEDDEEQSTDTNPKSTRSEPKSPSREKEEYFYSQFLANERTRAHQAVQSLQKNHTSPQSQSRSVGQEEKRKPEKSIPRPFPVSSPPRTDRTLRVPKTMPSLQNRGTITANRSFDDEISAISAHTLEEMARQDEIKKHRALGPLKSDLTELDTLTSMEESTLFPPTPDRLLPKKAWTSPVSLARNNNTHSKRSFGTKSTQSTNSGFSSVWRRDERRYWETVVEEEQQQLQHEQSSVGRAQEPQKLVTNGTLTTSGSSYFSSMGHNNRHPHDTIPLDRFEEVTRVVHIGHANKYDPDRIREVLILNHDTELGEI